jgi:hypothetical protein
VEKNAPELFANNGRTKKIACWHCGEETIYETYYGIPDCPYCGLTMKPFEPYKAYNIFCRLVYKKGIDKIVETGGETPDERKTLEEYIQSRKR